MADTIQLSRRSRRAAALKRTATLASISLLLGAFAAVAATASSHDPQPATAAPPVTATTPAPTAAPTPAGLRRARHQRALLRPGDARAHNRARRRAEPHDAYPHPTELR